jgi:hypothetical protein
MGDNRFGKLRENPGKFPFGALPKTFEPSELRWRDAVVRTQCSEWLGRRRFLRLRAANLQQIRSCEKFLKCLNQKKLARRQDRAKPKNRAASAPWVESALFVSMQARRKEPMAVARVGRFLGGLQPFNFKSLARHGAKRGAQQ